MFSNQCLIAHHCSSDFTLDLLMTIPFSARDKAKKEILQLCVAS